MRRRRVEVALRVLSGEPVNFMFEEPLVVEGVGDAYVTLRHPDEGDPVTVRADELMAALKKVCGGSRAAGVA
jgi:hypothetical protein